jgi:hypothetical protein
MSKVESFQIAVSQGEPNDLRDGLQRTRRPANSPATSWERGVPVAYLRELADYWSDAYDWRVREAIRARLKAGRALGRKSDPAESGEERASFLHALMRRHAEDIERRVRGCRNPAEVFVEEVIGLPRSGVPETGSEGRPP